MTVKRRQTILSGCLPGTKNRCPLHHTPYNANSVNTKAPPAKTANTDQTTPMDIIHLDMDAFFASVEVLDNPHLKGRPVIVGGSAERGVVSAASYEARRFGVHSALPMALARKRCPQGVFLPVRMARYQELSAAILAIFFRFTPLVEPLSLDEAFLDVSGCRALFGPPEAIARRLKELIHLETGLTCSAGVASSKLVAKIASDLEKPDGLTVVPPGMEREFLAPLAIERLWGVGKSTRKTLRMMGVKNIGDLNRLPESILTGKFGKPGRGMHRAALGIDHRPVVTERPVQSVGNEETFATDLTDPAAIRRELLTLATRVGRRLRRAGLRGRTITLKIKYHDFAQISRSTTLAEASADDQLLYRTCWQLLQTSERAGSPIRLLGITAANLVASSSGRQLKLFPLPGNTTKKNDALHAAMDKIRDKFGEKSLQRGTQSGQE